MPMIYGGGAELGGRSSCIIYCMGGGRRPHLVGRCCPSPSTCTLLASPEWAKFMADHDGNDYDTKRRLLILFAGKHMCFMDALLSLEMNCMNGIITYLPTAVYCLE